MNSLVMEERRRTFPVVRPSGSRVNESTSNPRDEEGIRDSKFDSVIEGSLGSFQHGVQLGCLGDSSWETIKDETGY